MTDTVTGLIWLHDASCLGQASYAGANQRADQLGADTADGATCGLTDNSNPGDWRLPTKKEWDATIARAVALGCTSAGAHEPPSLTGTAGGITGSNPTGCFDDEPVPAFSGVQSNYWSSSAIGANPGSAWYVVLNNGITFSGSKDFSSGIFVWPVRGGQ